MPSDFIESSKYQGHVGSVTCLDISSSTSHNNLLVSGSEDGTARIWDLRSHRRRAVSCIQTHGEVSSVKLGTEPLVPTLPGGAEDETEAPSLQSPFAHDVSVFLSVENCVYGYDLRKATTPVIQQPTLHLSPILQHQDDVNQLQLVRYQPPPARPTLNSNNKKKSTKKKSKPQPQPPSLYLASCDDAGTVRLTDLYTHTTSTTATPSCQVYAHDPNRVSLVPACCFRPLLPSSASQKPSSNLLEFVSGGTDCKLHLWNVGSTRISNPKPTSSLTMTAPDETTTDNHNTEQQSQKPQVCNPPMIYSLDFSPSGQLLAAGLGNGDVSLLRMASSSSASRSKLVQAGWLTPGHDASVASVVFPSFCRDNERVLLTAGNDGAILCWDLGSSEAFWGSSVAVPNNPRELFAESLVVAPDDETNNNNNLTDQMEGLSMKEEQEEETPKILFGIPHGTKPNWMVTSGKGGDPAMGTLFVADTSNDITAYSIPLR